MKIVLDVDCAKPEEFQKVLLIIKSFKYPTSYKDKTIKELTDGIYFKNIDLEATYNELSAYIQMDVKKGVKE